MMLPSACRGQAKSLHSEGRFNECPVRFTSGNSAGQAVGRPGRALRAAANAAGEDAGRFRNEIGAPLPAFWLASRLCALLSYNDRVRLEAEGARLTWETAIFGEAAADSDPGQLDRRLAATRHLATRGWFYPLLFPRLAPSARWRIDRPEQVEHELGPMLEDPARLYVAPIDVGTIAVSRPFVKNGVREYWLRAPTPVA
ncbi:MAG: hypothetical protein Q8L22_30895 [Reyranella sp.]|nr:hypothetical protein [Reyranella sp.]